MRTHVSRFVLSQKYHVGTVPGRLVLSVRPANYFLDITDVGWYQCWYSTKNSTREVTCGVATSSVVATRPSVGTRRLLALSPWPPPLSRPPQEQDGALFGVLECASALALVSGGGLGLRLPSAAITGTGTGDAGGGTGGGGGGGGGVRASNKLAMSRMLLAFDEGV